MHLNKTTRAPQQSRVRAAYDRSLTVRLGTSDNALNFVRLVCASLVIFGHAFPLGGFQAWQWGPLVHGGWHGLAVEGFFAVSGYLILSSGLKGRAKPFLWRRFLRIYPGYVVALIVTAFAFAPAATALGAEWRTGEAIRYLLKSLTLKAGDLPVHARVPWPATWNGSLWTLFYEALAYVGVAVLISLPILRRHILPTVITLTILSTGGHLMLSPEFLGSVLPENLTVILGNGLRLWTYFCWGMLARCFSDRIRPGALGLGLASTLLLVHLLVPSFPWHVGLNAPLLTYVVLAAGAVLPIRLGSRNDISYGVYVYAFPVQQFLVLAGVNEFGWLATSLSCLVLTVPLAWASWLLIEKPTLRLKDWVK